MILENFVTTLECFDMNIYRTKSIAIQELIRLLLECKKYYNGHFKEVFILIEIQNRRTEIILFSCWKFVKLEDK